MDHRIDAIDLPGLDQLQAECPWFRMTRVLGRAAERVVLAEYRVRAFAWQRDQRTPTIRSGPWPSQFVLTRGMALQPLVRVLPDAEEYLPASGNISGWEAQADRGRRGEAMPGLVCYADRWDPQLTLAWLAYQVARILVGEVLSLEARPLSVRGRDFQAEALAQGKLPTEVIRAPAATLLVLQASGERSEEPSDAEIEFDESRS